MSGLGSNSEVVSLCAAVRLHLESGTTRRLFALLAHDLARRLVITDIVARFLFALRDPGVAFWFYQSTTLGFRALFTY